MGQEFTDLDNHNDLDWFSRLLPTKCLNARVFRYNYQLHALHGARIETFDESANNLQSLCGDIDTSYPYSSMGPSIEAEIVERPLLFVCHGLGGILVKRALLSSADKRNERSSMICRTFGTIFLGTPHSNDASYWAEILRSTSTPADISRSLVNTQPNEAREWAKKWTSSFNTDTSALIYRRGRPLSLPTHFSEISKMFESVTPLYKNVYFCLQSNSSCHPATSLHEECLWSMSSQSMDSDHAEIHYIIPTALPWRIVRYSEELAVVSMSEAAERKSREISTCLHNQKTLQEMHAQQRLAESGRWLWERDDVRSWMNGEGSPLLWLSGAPGCGKSTTCSAVIDSIRNREKQSGTTFYCFFEQGYHCVDAAKHVLKTLLYQIKEHQRPLVSNHVVRESLNILNNLITPTAMGKFRETMGFLLAGVDYQAQLTLLVDGVDEDDWINCAIIDEVHRVNHSSKRSIPIRCIISTRIPYNASSLGKQVAQVRLDGEPGLQRDILRYALSRLATLTPNTSSKKVATESLARQLCLRANGNFLWATLAVEDVLESHNNLLNAIESMPMTVDALYQRRLRDIPTRSQGLAQIIFFWLIGARQLLHFSDLLHVLDFEFETHSVTQTISSDAVKLKKQFTEDDLYRICGSFIVLSESGFVRLIHQSVREFLLCPNKIMSSKNCTLDAHETIAATCLRYLSSSTEGGSTSLFATNLTVSSNRDSRAPSQFATYVVTNWSFHYRLAESHSRVLVGLLQHHLSVTLEKVCDASSMRQSQRPSQISSFVLRYGALYGLAALVQMSLEVGCDPNGNACQNCETPLKIAAAKQSSDSGVLQTLLQKGASTTHKTTGDFNATLWLAVDQGLSDAVELNLIRGADPNMTDELGQAPLHIAARQGNLKVVILLMECGANLNATLPLTFETPLHIAAANGHLSVLKCLIFGRDVSKKEISLFQSIVQQPLFQRWTDDSLGAAGPTQSFVWEMDARDSAEQCVEELSSYTSRYVEIDKRTFEGLTALDLAASTGNEEIVEFLLARGAILHSCENDRRTALQHAAENGHIDTVRLLIQAGASTKLAPEKLKASIRSAHAKGYYDIAQLLSFQIFTREVTGKACNWHTIAVAIKHDLDSVPNALVTGPPKDFLTSTMQETLPFRYAK